MGKFKDITGQKFGRLTALYRLNNYHKKGTYCLRKENTSKMFKTHGLLKKALELEE